MNADEPQLGKRDRDNIEDNNDASGSAAKTSQLVPCREGCGKCLPANTSEDHCETDETIPLVDVWVTYLGIPMATAHLRKDEC